MILLAYVDREHILQLAWFRLLDSWISGAYSTRQISLPGARSIYSQKSVPYYLYYINSLYRETFENVGSLEFLFDRCCESGDAAKGCVCLSLGFRV